jgi:hypothetical protein
VCEEMTLKPKVKGQGLAGSTLLRPLETATITLACRVGSSVKHSMVKMKLGPSQKALGSSEMTRQTQTQRGPGVCLGIPHSYSCSLPRTPPLKQQHTDPPISDTIASQEAAGPRNDPPPRNKTPSTWAFRREDSHALGMSPGQEGRGAFQGVAVPKTPPKAPQGKPSLREVHQHINYWDFY